jgi:hypothetical protein
MSALPRHRVPFVRLALSAYWAALMLICLSSCGGGRPELASVPSTTVASATDILNCVSSQCVTFPPAPQDCAIASSADVSCYSRMAFWYEPLARGPALWRLTGSQVIIGVPADAVSAVHSINARALAYVTYYQSSAPGDYIGSTADLSSVGFLEDGQYLPSLLDPGRYVLCPNSMELGRRVAVQLSRLLNQHYDGLFVDNTFLAPPATLVCQAAHAHVTPGQRGDDSFLYLLSQVREALAQGGTSPVVVSNPGTPGWADHLGTGRVTLWDLSDFVVWESYGYSSDLDHHDNWQDTLTKAWSYAADPIKSVKIIALSYPTNTREALFSFALARIFNFRWTANLGVSGERGHYGEFASLMPFSLGVPQGPVYKAGEILARRFSNGIAYANTGKVPAGILVPDAGRMITAAGQYKLTGNYGLLLPAFEAAVLVAH